MHENLHKNVFLWRAIKATNVLQLYTAIFIPYMDFKSILNDGQVLLDCIRFSQFWCPNAFFPQIQQGPGPNFRKVGQSLKHVVQSFRMH